MFLSSLLEATDEECIKKMNCKPLEKDWSSFLNTNFKQETRVTQQPLHRIRHYRLCIISCVAYHTFHDETWFADQTGSSGIPPDQQSSVMRDPRTLPSVMQCESRNHSKTPNTRSFFDQCEQLNDMRTQKADSVKQKHENTATLMAGKHRRLHLMHIITANWGFFKK